MTEKNNLDVLASRRLVDCQYERRNGNRIAAFPNTPPPHYSITPRKKACFFRRDTLSFTHSLNSIPIEVMNG